MKTADSKVRATVTAFFAAYAEAAASGNNAVIAASYAEVYMEADPASAAVITNDGDYRAALDARTRVMTSQFGLRDARVEVLDVYELAPGHVLVPTEWTMDFDPPGGEPVTAEFEQTYVVRVSGGQPEILFYVSHVQQEEAMRELGLLG